jgi:NADH-quinone oxidoreductase subunit A
MGAGIEQYAPLVLLLALASSLGAVLLFFSQAFGPSRPTKEKEGTFECGVEPVGNARTRFPVRYYLVALVFVVFDLEAVFIYPWAVTFRDLRDAGMGPFALMEMLTFMGILVIGYIYLWRRGALDWES